MPGRRVEDLLFDGETIRETVDLDSGEVVVTSHRVLAFTRQFDGANFQQADLPNVEGVGAGARSKGGLLERAIKAAAVGVVLVGTGLVVDFGGILGDVDLGGGAGEQIGVGGMLGPIQALLGFLRNLDQYMGALGALALLLAGALFGVYWHLREPTLVVEVAGGDDIHVPRTGGDDADVVSRLERAITATPASGPAGEQPRGADPAGEP